MIPSRQSSPYSRLPSPAGRSRGSCTTLVNISVTSMAGEAALRPWVSTHRVPTITCPCPCIRATDVSPNTCASLGGKAWNAISGHHGSLAMPGPPWNTISSIRSMP
jgi:hypothetical protein